LGVYVSDHPLSSYMQVLAEFISHYSGELEDVGQDEIVHVAGEVSAVRPYQTRAGKPMGFVTLEDLQGSLELVVFPRVWTRVVEWLETGVIVRVEGRIDQGRGSPKVLVNEIHRQSPVAEMSEGGTELEGGALSADEAVYGMGDEYDDLTVPSGDDDMTQVSQAEEDPAGGLEDFEGAEDADEEFQSEAAGGEEGGFPVDQQDRKASTRTSMEAKTPESEIEVETETSQDPQHAHEAELTSRSIGQEEIRRVFASLTSNQSTSSGDLSLIKIFLRSTGDKKRDTLRMRRVYGLLTSFPGFDRFSVVVFEGKRKYHLEFPNETTGYCPELHNQLLDLVGDANVLVEQIRLQ
jgi:DNA polymerase-3 subunit alpha